MQNFIKTLISAAQTWTKKEIKNEINNIPSSIPDWNINDPNTGGYIKNRTHYHEKTNLVADFSFEADVDSYYYSENDWPLFNTNMTYCVVYNGVEYLLKAETEYTLGSDELPFCFREYEGRYVSVKSRGLQNFTIYEVENIKKIDDSYMTDNIATTKYVDNSLETKLDSVDPSGKGSFSINRTRSSIGKYSSALGNELIAKHLSENALGQFNKNDNVNYIIVENTEERSQEWKNSAFATVSTSYNFNSETGVFELVDGIRTRAADIQPGQYYLSSSIAIWLFLSNEPYDSTYRKLTFIMIGRESATSAKGKYLQTIGNGESDSNRSNAYTLDWNGTGWFQGGLQVGGTEQDGEGVGYVPAVSGPVQPGQILSVKSVDENSKPTEWEVVDAIKTVNNIAPDENGNVELDEGFSPIATVEQTDDGAVISITDKDGTTTATITNGQRGRSILHITSKPSVNTTTVGDITPPYRVDRKDVMDQAGVGKDDILYGDIIESGSTHYKVLTVFSRYVYLDNPVSIKGVDGANGKSAYEYAQEAGYTGTETQFAKKLASDNGVSSWNALSDKPFYEMDTLFDGNTSGHEVVMFSESLSFVKMNDHVFTEEECVGKVVSMYIEANDTVAEMSISANGIVDLADLASGFSGFLVFPDELMTYEIPAVMIVKEPIFTDYISLSAGTYYAVVDSDSIGKGHTTYFSAFDDVVTIKKLDEKYLPDNAVQVEAVKKAVNPYFEGNIDGYTFLMIDVLNEEDGIGGLVKITDYVLTEEECLGATVTVSYQGLISNHAITKKVDFTDAVGLPCDAYYADGSSAPYVVVIKSSGIGSGIIEGVEVSAGTYYLYMDTSGMDGGKTFITHFSALDNKEVIEEKINPKYLPNEVALKSDIPSIEGLASEEYVNDLINTALSAIPNAAEVAY